MCSWRRVAVARVFALVVRCSVMRLLLYSRVGKNRDTSRESPAGAGAACAAGHKFVLFSQKILAAQKAMTYTVLLGVVVNLYILNQFIYCIYYFFICSLFPVAYNNLFNNPFFVKNIKYRYCFSIINFLYLISGN